MRFLSRQPAREIWFDDTDTPVTGIAAGGRVDVPALEPVTFVVRPGQIVYVEFYTPWNTHALVGGHIRNHISDNAGADTAAGVKATAFSAKAYAVGAEVGSILVRERLSVPGTYTRKPQVGSNSASGVHGMLANAASKPHFRVLQAKA